MASSSNIASELFLFTFVLSKQFLINVAHSRFDGAPALRQHQSSGTDLLRGHPERRGHDFSSLFWRCSLVCRFRPGRCSTAAICSRRSRAAQHGSRRSWRPAALATDVSVLVAFAAVGGGPRATSALAPPET